MTEPRLLDILDAYVPGPPTGENALNIFQGEWSSRLPPPYDKSSGAAGLFEDPRISWAIELLGAIDGFRVLELGPLEAGHTTMLEKAGAESITAIEANTRAFLKCLVVKELLGLRRSNFLCGDFMTYLREEPGTFDLCVASGVLYHLVEPIEFLTLVGSVSDRLLLWTHYYDEEILNARPDISPKFGPAVAMRSGSFDYQQVRYEYYDALAWQGFCGGSASYSNWLTRDDILKYLRFIGYNSIEIAFDQKTHQNGPAFAVLAQRR